MQFEHSYSKDENRSAKLLAEYTSAAEPLVAVHLPNGCSSSHLVGSQAGQCDEGFDAAQFEALLTDYDRILLRFGMHIFW